MNGPTHVSLNRVAARIICERGGGASELLEAGDSRSLFASAASLPDRVTEITVDVPGEGPRSEFAGHGFSSFQHFQTVGGRGYRWASDRSLIGSTLTSLISSVGGMRVVECRAGIRPPLADNTDPTPIVCAAACQPGRAVGSFLFPPASDSATYYADAASAWGRARNAAGFARCAGYALHFVQDSLVPHHGWGCLLYGHGQWEDELQARWAETVDEVDAAGLFDDTIRSAVDAELQGLDGAANVGALCCANADWSRRHFGDARELAECSGDVALWVAIRAIATSVVATDMMTMERKTT